MARLPNNDCPYVSLHTWLLYMWPLSEPGQDYNSVGLDLGVWGQSSAAD